MAVRVTLCGEEPQDATADGATWRRTLGVLPLAVRVKPVSVGRQVKASALLPETLVASYVMVTGLVFHSALGCAAETIPTAANAPIIMRLIERATMRWGRCRLIEDNNCILVAIVMNLRVASGRMSTLSALPRCPGTLSRDEGEVA